MLTKDSLRVLLCTCPDRDTGLAIAEALVGQQLAACVNLLPGVGSVYRWQGQIERAEEILLLVKTTAARYAAVEAAILARHPYELPEILAVPVSDVLSAYAAWLSAAVEEEK